MQQSNKKFHYVYQITELSSNKKYIGVRSSNIDPKKDLGKKYFSSSTDKIFIKNQKENPSNYKYEILSTHNNREDANLEEMRLHELYNVDINENFINRYCSFSDKFTTYNKIVIINEEGNYELINKTDNRFTCGLVHGNVKDMIPVKDINGKTTHVNKNDPRYISGELKHVSTGRIITKDKHGNTKSVYKNDPDYIDGKIISEMTGYVTVKDKNGNTFRTTKNNPEYINGNLVSANKGLITLKDQNDNIIITTKDDPRYLSGELVGVNKGYIFINNGIKTKRIPKSEPIPKGWTKGRLKKS